MALRQTRLYYNTGFNVGNTPGNINILNSANYVDLEQHWDFQDYFLNSITLKATWDTVKNADYLKYGDGYYWITGIKMHNTNTAEMFLSLDALATLGGAETLSYTSGLIKRAHPLADEPFMNTLEEPVGLYREMRCTDNRTVGPGDLLGTQFFISTLSLDQEITVDKETGEVKPQHGSAYSYNVVGEDAGSVIIPNSPKTDKGTTLGTVAVKGVSYYVNAKGDIADQIAYLRTLGLENAVIGSYLVPNGYANGTYVQSTTRNYISSLANKNFEPISAQNWNASQGSTWSKTLTLYNSYILVSKITGEVKSYDAKSLCHSDSGYIDAPQFLLYSDTKFKGKPYIYPRYFEGKDNTSAVGQNGISGAEWLEVPVVVGGASGSQWVKNDYVRNTADLAWKTVDYGAEQTMNLLDTLNPGHNTTEGNARVPASYGGDRYDTTGQGFGPSEFAHWTYDTLKGARTLNYTSNKLDQEFTQRMNFNVPKITGNNLVGLQTSIANNFIIYHFIPEGTDLQNLDRFFTKYGYAQNCAFRKEYLTTDIKNLGYNYIQTSDVHIGRTGRASQCGVAIKNLAEQQLNNGIRIWHKLPA